MNNYKLTKNNNIVELHFECNELRYECKLHLEKLAWAEVAVWDEQHHGYLFEIYQHINDLLFCITYTRKDDRSVEHASYWHSVANLFDEDNLRWTEQQKVDETIEAFSTLVEQQLKLYKKM
ncbi:MAG: hypothetical protein II983_06230 [Firmicutes bacterium]|nr:hypothetical protein [Bacillota bacterium]MBQ6345539.1 hypothetical protein [Methanobrevibacter sp.]MBQ6629767.1 hypothetical protein [Methanobrevibacter sp.]